MQSDEKLQLTGITPRSIMYMDSHTNYPFHTIYQVLDYFQFNKRGRLKSVNLLEEEHGSGSGAHIDLRWELCFFAIQRGIKHCTKQQIEVFRLRYCTDYPDQYTRGEIVAGIAAHFGKKKSTIYQWLDEIIEDVEREAQDLRLISTQKVH